MNTTVAAVKALTVYMGKALLLRRSANDRHGPGIWEFPGGKLDFGEKLEAAVLREVQEETGLSVSLQRLLYGTSFLTDTDRQVVLLCYLCHAASARVTLSAEHQDYRWVNRQELEQLIDKGILRDLQRFHVFNQAEIKAAGL